MYLSLTLLAYLIDKLFGEFSFIRHPVIIMGDYITWFEKKFYKNSIKNGFVLTISLLFFTFLIINLIVYLFSYLPYTSLQLSLLALLSSTTIASKMLYDSVEDIIKNPHHIKYLVSRDTKNLTPSEINKATIETYAENLSDGVVAPLFYLLLFGVEGAFIYKAINTLDSMVGYRNKRYENFGKISAILDDIANYIPSRMTAILIALLMGSKKSLFLFYSYGKKHSSPNAGHPISAMALAIKVKLGGDTSYFGEIRKKAYFGEEREEIRESDIRKSLSFQWRLDILLIISLGVFIWI